MKNMIWSFLFFFMLLGCNDDDNTNQEEQEQERDPRIYGTWQLVEVGGGAYGAEGFHYVSRPIPNGYIIGFFEDLRFISICNEDGEELEEGVLVGPCGYSNGKNMDGSYTISRSYTISYGQDSITRDGDFIALFFDEIIVDGFATGEFARKRILRFRFKDRYLILNGPQCDEGCHEVFERIQETEEE